MKNCTRLLITALLVAGCAPGINATEENQEQVNAEFEHLKDSRSALYLQVLDFINPKNSEFTFSLSECEDTTVYKSKDMGTIGIIDVALGKIALDVYAASRLRKLSFDGNIDLEKLQPYLHVFPNLKSLNMNHTEISLRNFAENDRKRYPNYLTNRFQNLQQSHENLFKRVCDFIDPNKSTVNFYDYEDPKYIDIALNKIALDVDAASRIRKLSFEGNTYLKKLPSSLDKFSNLEFLNLSGTAVVLSGLQLLSKPSDTPLALYPFDKLTALKYLDISNNRAHERKLLRGLDASLIAEPAELSDGLFDKLLNLETLDLSGNYLRKLPTSIAKATKLVNLNLEDNSLKELPDSLSGLKNLKSLKVSDNPPFTKLPAWITDLSELQDLRLSNNKQLTKLPKEMESLKKLKNLTLPKSLDQDAQTKEIGNTLKNTNNTNVHFSAR